MQKEPKYFMAIFGKKYVSIASVNDGHYRPYMGWVNDIGICGSDRILLYCARGYSKEYSRVAPGIGKVTDVKDDTVYYEYELLPSPVPLSVIRECFAPADKVKLEQIRFWWQRLFVIEQTSFSCVLRASREQK